MSQTSFSTAIVDEFSGTTKDQRDKWIKAFWQRLDENPDNGAIVRRWQKAGCDPRKIAITIHRYVIGYSSKLNAQRKERREKAEETLKTAVQTLRDLETLYRVYDQVEAADRIANEARVAQEVLARVKSAFNTKRLGVSRSWTDLAMIEGFVLEATKQPPTPQELVSLIKAGRESRGSKSRFLGNESSEHP